MRDFFKSWRPKVGSVALLLALLAMVGWARSSLRRDTVMLGRGLTIIGISVRGHLSMGIMRGSGRDVQFWSVVKGDVPAWGYDANEAIDSFNAPTIGHIRMAAVSNGITVFGGRFHFYHESLTSFWFAGCWLPYWSIVLPLTLISAYLLLWKPRTPVEASPPQCED